MERFFRMSRDGGIDTRGGNMDGWGWEHVIRALHDTWKLKIQI